MEEVTSDYTAPVAREYMGERCDQCEDSTYMPGPKGETCWSCEASNLVWQFHAASRELADLRTMLGEIEEDFSEKILLPTTCATCGGETPTWFSQDSRGHCVKCVAPCKCGRYVTLKRAEATGGLCFFCEHLALERMQAVGGKEAHIMTVHLAIIQGWLDDHKDESFLHLVINDLVEITDRTHAMGTDEERMDKLRSTLKARVMEMASNLSIEPPPMSFPGDPKPFVRKEPTPTWDDVHSDDDDDDTRDD